MNVKVELFGVPRARAGVSQVDLEFPDDQTSLGEVLTALVRMFPNLAGECILEAGLASGYTANRDGEAFVRDVGAKILDGQSLLIMSADAGG